MEIISISTRLLHVCCHIHREVILRKLKLNLSIQSMYSDRNHAKQFWKWGYGLCLKGSEFLLKIRQGEFALKRSRLKGRMAINFDMPLNSHEGRFIIAEALNFMFFPSACFLGTLERLSFWFVFVTNSNFRTSSCHLSRCSVVSKDFAFCIYSLYRGNKNRLMFKEMGLSVHHIERNSWNGILNFPHNWNFALKPFDTASPRPELIINGIEIKTFWISNHIRLCFMRFRRRVDYVRGLEKEFTWVIRSYCKIISAAYCFFCLRKIQFEKGKLNKFSYFCWTLNTYYRNQG